MRTNTFLALRALVAAAVLGALVGACGGEAGGPPAVRDADVAVGADATPDATRDVGGAPDGTTDAIGDAGAPDTAVADTAGDSTAVADTAGDATAVADTATGPPPSDRYRNVLASAADYGFVAKEGEVKWLAPVEGRETPPPLDAAACWFQNMNLAEWHHAFLVGFEELAGLTFDDYVTWVTDPEARVLWGGTLRAYPAVRHPETGRPGIYAWLLYTDMNRPDAMAPEDVPTVHAILRASAPFAADLLVFVVHGERQKQAAAVMGPGWTEAGVPWLMPEELVAGVPFVSYSEGEGYGTLRVTPRGAGLAPDGYGPRDIVVVESAPNDIAIVQGLITADPQNVHSHVNLRLLEKGTPNAALPDVYDTPLVTSLDGALVHLVVAADGVTLTPARLEDARAFWEAQQPPLGEVRADLGPRDLRSFADLGGADAAAYGAKAANLGELWGVLGPANRVDGFGVPLGWYREFVAANALGDAIRALLADPRIDEDRTYRTAALASLRRSLRRGRLPDGFEAALHARLREVFGAAAETTRVRFRSSTNAEDLDAFSGAGLYDSRSGCLGDDLDGDEIGPSRCLGSAERAWIEAELTRRRAEWAAHPERTWLRAIIDELEDDLTSEKPVAAAVRKVWASLWNDRAFEERAYYGIDHDDVLMGMAVNAAFALERVNAVAVTNLAPSGAPSDGVPEGAPLYRLVSQAGEWSVVRPEDPLAVPEVLTFRRVGDPPAMADVQVLVPSPLVPAGERVWPDAALVELADALFAIQDHFAAAVYPDLAPLRLDCEVKLTDDGRVVVKQARPFLGGM